MTIWDILLVDDSPAERDLAVEASREFGAGMHLITAGTPEEAVTQLQIVRPAFVLIDLHLGRWHGRHLLAQLRGSRGTFILTTTDDPLESRLCLKSGADGFWVKPARFADFSTLFARLRVLLLTSPA